MTGIPPKFNPDDVPPLWVLRHGETEWNVEGRLQGGLDSTLTPLGVAQAQDQARILTQIGVPAEAELLCSPAGRAQATAKIALAGFSGQVQVDDNLVEIGLGAWQGRLIGEVRPEGAGEDAQADPHMWKFAGPGCESLEQMVARVTRFLVARKGPAVIVTHGVTSRVVRCLALGLPPADLSGLPGGQGVVHHVAGGQGRVLRLKPDHLVDAERYDAQGGEGHRRP